MLVELEIVKLETAILALEKGFDCYGWSAYMYEAKYHEDSDMYELEDIKYMIPDKYWTSKLKLCPQSLIQKWLREKYNIIIWVAPLEIQTAGKEGLRYTWVISKSNDLKYEKSDKSPLGFLSFEEALEKALTVGLSLI